MITASVLILLALLGLLSLPLAIGLAVNRNDSRWFSHRRWRKTIPGGGSPPASARVEVSLPRAQTSAAYSVDPRRPYRASSTLSASPKDSRTRRASLQRVKLAIAAGGGSRRRTETPHLVGAQPPVQARYDLAAGVRFIRRSRSVNRGSPRNRSNSGSTASNAMYQSRSWYACSSHLNARSVSPSPI